MNMSTYLTVLYAVYFTMAANCRRIQLTIGVQRRLLFTMLLFMPHNVLFCPMFISLRSDNHAEFVSGGDL